MAIKYGTNEGNYLSGSASSADSIFGWDRDNAPGDEGPDTDNDILMAYGNDLISGGGGNDQLSGGYGHDTLLGGSGNDAIFARSGSNNVFDGGAGIDTLHFGFAAGAAVVFSALDLSHRVELADGSTVTGFEDISTSGGEFNDSITGGHYGDTIYGNAGDDTLRGGDGNDLLEGDQGNDQIFGGNGDDTIRVYGPLDADEVHGGFGIDVLVYNTFNGAVNSTMVLGYQVTLPDGSQATGFERLDYTGNSGTDIVTGGNWNDTINGREGGDDILTGRDGDDLLVGSNYAPLAGDVTLYGGAGDDTLQALMTEGNLISGGEGVDLLVLSLSDNVSGISFDVADLAGSWIAPEGAVIKGIERVNLYGTGFADRMAGGVYGDSLFGYQGTDSLYGGAGNDYLSGGRGDDTLIGGDGDDWLFEEEGTNVMFGAGGNDLIEVSRKIQKVQFMYGGNGDDSLIGNVMGDVLNGGAGSDDLRGRAGADQFVFNTAPVASEVDTIQDFGNGADVIVLRLAAFAGLLAGPLSADDFVLGTAALDATDRILYDAATGSVWYDADGLAGADAVRFLTVTSLTNLGANGFLVA